MKTLNELEKEQSKKKETTVYHLVNACSEKGIDNMVKKIRNDYLLVLGVAKQPEKGVVLYPQAYMKMKEHIDRICLKILGKDLRQSEKDRLLVEQHKQFETFSFRDYYMLISLRLQCCSVVE